MRLKDARHLSPKAQEALRYRVVNAVDKGMSKTKAAQIFGVSRTAVHHWTKAYSRRGAKALKGKKRGRRYRSRLAPYQAATTVRLIKQKCPDELGMNFSLWTREAVRQLLKQRYDVSVSIWTVGRYLKRWKMTPQKPLRRAYQQDPKAVQKWLKTDYPEIVKLAKQEGARIHWGDEMGLCADYQAGYSYSKRGKTPVINDTGTRFRCNLISTLTNRGKLSFKVFGENFNSEVMLDFLRRLIRHSQQKVFMIVDRHPVHLSRRVNHWLETHTDQIRMFLLPSYSPQLNPDELLNHDIKANAVGRKRVKTKEEMLENIRRHLHRRQKQPQVIRNFFREKHVSYAA